MPSRSRMVSRRSVPIAAFAAAILAMSCAPSLAGPVMSPSSVARSGGCQSIILYFSRGSGQKDRDPTHGLSRPGFQVYRELLRTYAGQGVTVGSVANAYPAVNVGPTYGRSVKLGIRSAHRNLSDLIALCPHSLLVLGGFSQGAQVTRGALKRLTAEEREHVAAVVLFGDPFFDPGDAASGPQQPSSAHVLPYNPKRHGRLRTPLSKNLINAVFAGKVFSWCHGRDLVCQGRLHHLARHSEYSVDAPDAARAIATVLAARGIPPKPPMPPVTYPHTIVGGTCHAPACGLATFRGPGMTAFSVAGTLVNGQRVGIVCQTTGETLHGLNGRTSAIWDRLSDGTFVPDFYVNTPGIGHRSSGIPGCAKLTHTA